MLKKVVGCLAHRVSQAAVFNCATDMPWISDVMATTISDDPGTARHGRLGTARTARLFVRHGTERMTWHGTALNTNFDLNFRHAGHGVRATLG